MKKIVSLTSGSILLLGALFYGLSLINQHPSPAPTPSGKILPKPVNPPGVVSTPANAISPDSSHGNPAAEQADEVVTTRGTNVQPESRQTAGIQKNVTRTSGNSAGLRSETVGGSVAPSQDEPAQSQAPVGLRLAPDVRLPVAAMPLNFKVSPVAKKAIDQIVEDYYRELASPPPMDQNGNVDPGDASTGVIEESETGELTRIVTNGPAVDAARQRADSRFKALFGNEAYNRMTMNTLLEARLPVTQQK